jgi:hypothetical protein
LSVLISASLRREFLDSASFIAILNIFEIVHLMYFLPFSELLYCSAE